MLRPEDRTVLIEEYLDGISVPQLSRQNGISERRIYQILDAAGVKRKRPNRSENIQPLSEVHRKVGKKVYDFYFDAGMDRAMASAKLGMSAKQLASIERGTKSLELLILMDLASFMKITVGELIGE